jgi:hypothetical protein
VPYSSKKKARKEDGLRWTRARVGLRKEATAGLLSLSLPQNIFLIHSEFRRRKGDRETLRKISKQVSNIFSKT